MSPLWIEQSLMGLMGGVIIGIAVSLMLVLNGRVTGVSGILNGALAPQKGDTSWRVFFLAGLFLGGLFLSFTMPQAFDSGLNNNLLSLVGAGLLVGFGTVMGSGCTSGHGVCGISRFSVRSLVATLVFICAGVGTVALMAALKSLFS